MILARYVGTRLIGWTESLLEGRFRLTVNREKTRVVRLRQPGECLDFLGYSFRYDRDLHGSGRRYWNLFPAKKSLTKARAKVRELTDSRWCFARATSVIANVNDFLRGWGMYFSRGYPKQAYRDLNQFVVLRLTRHLQAPKSTILPPSGGNFVLRTPAWARPLLVGDDWIA